jgi:hypothetical protein
VSELFRNERRREALNLTRYPVQEIVSAVGGPTTLTGSDYELDGVAGQLFRVSNDCRICWCFDKLVIDYIGGYYLPDDEDYEAGADDSLPADIERAAILACAAAYQGRGRDPMVKRTIIPNVIEEDYWVGTDPAQGESGLPAEAERLLAPYRAPALG